MDVPEGVEVELTGFDVLGDRELRLAPVPRRPGTAFIRIRAHGLLGDVYVRTPAEGEKPPSWWSWFRPSRALLVFDPEDPDRPGSTSRR